MDASPARVIISGIGVYSGEKVVTFVIKEKSIENCTVLTVASLNYNGNLQTPPVIVTYAVPTAILLR